MSYGKAFGYCVAASSAAGAVLFPAIALAETRRDRGFKGSGPLGEALFLTGLYGITGAVGGACLPVVFPMFILGRIFTGK
jgi:hypothetical protein